MFTKASSTSDAVPQTPSSPDLPHQHTSRPQGTASVTGLTETKWAQDTLGEETQWFSPGEPPCACWGWFVSMCLIWSSAVTMAWRVAKRLLTLIAVSSYVRVLLTRENPKADDNAAELEKIGTTQNAFPLCTHHVNNEEDAHKVGKELMNLFRSRCIIKSCALLKWFPFNKF